MTLTINTAYRAKNLGSYKSGKRPKILAIVLHDTAGNGGTGDLKYLINDPENRGVSVDFVVLRDGGVYQLNPDLTRYSTGHAGRKTFLARHNKRNGAVNSHTLGIELAHKADPKKDTPIWPVDQIIAVAQLCKMLCEKFGLGPEDITTHAKIITDGSRSDPRDFPWPTFWANFSGNGVSLPPTGGNPVPDTRVFHVVQAGETLYSLSRKYSTTVEAIKALNGYDTPSTLITVGQRLLVKE